LHTKLVAYYIVTFLRNKEGKITWGSLNRALIQK